MVKKMIKGLLKANKQKFYLAIPAAHQPKSIPVQLKFILNYNTEVCPADFQVKSQNSIRSNTDPLKPQIP